MLDHPGQDTLDVDRARERMPVVADSDVDPDLAFLRSRDRPAAVVSKTSLPIIDLFAGLGGMTIGALEGARRADRAAKLALAIDHEAPPLDVLGRTVGAEEACVVADLESVLGPIAQAWRREEKALFSDVPKDGLLLAGPPCQGHSALNNHTRHDDPRNDLYLAVARVARLIKPKAVIIENVRGIGSDRRHSLAQCMAALEEIGYEVEGRPLNLHDLGVPQRRIRYVVVATRNKRMSWDLPLLPGRTVRWAISDLLDVESKAAVDTPSRVSETNAERIKYLFEERAYDLPNPKRPKCHQDDHSYVSMYGRLDWDKPAQTITSGFGSMGQGRYVHPARRRTLTPHEAARLQFLPDFVAFCDTAVRRSATATMIGNVAPPKLTMVLVEALIAQSLL